MQKEVELYWEINPMEQIAKLCIIGADGAALITMDLTQAVRFHLATIMALAELAHSMQTEDGNLIKSVEEFLRCRSNSTGDKIV